MRRDLVRAIAEAKDVTNAIVLTHNIDFVFLQTVALSAFRRCGHPKLTIFADAQCAAESYRYQAPFLDGLGTRYRVVPVVMASGYRFHAKALLLSSEKGATLWVGSGNLTFGGWRENGEVWVEHDALKDLGALAAFKDYLNRILARVPLRRSVTIEIAEAFDPGSKAWAEDLEDEEASGLFGRVGEGPALLDDLLPADSAGVNRRVVVCAPFFDPEGAALRALEARADRVTVLTQVKNTTLTKEALKACGKGVSLKPVSFRRQGSSADEGNAFLHAKFIGVIQGKRTTVYAGSANCSKAALLASGSAGNAELMAKQELLIDEFEALFMSELEVDSEEAELPARQDIEEPRQTLPTLQILAARYESQSLTVAYVPARANVKSVEIDGATFKFSSGEQGSVIATVTGECRRVRIRADLNGREHVSEPFWIDHEGDLGTSARARTLADAIRKSVQPGKWTAAAWAEVMEVFCKHLTYMPISSVGASRPKHRENNDATKIFPFEDVFASGYRQPSLRGTEATWGRADSNQCSLQQLLLNWFGIRGDDQPAEQRAPEGDNDKEEVVDRPEDLKELFKKAGRHAAPPAGLDLRRLERITSQIDEAMSSRDFLEHRTPAALAGDIKFASVLLRVGLREGWLPQDLFYSLTFRVWASLFFSGSPEPGKGWLEYRVSESEEPQSFAAPLRTPAVAAALIGWALAIPKDAPHAELARFELACALAVARLPWLWGGTDRPAVERELKALLSQTSRKNAKPAKVHAAAEKFWSETVRRGQAVMQLERATRGVTPLQLSPKITQAKVRAGEILWQGRFCVALRDCMRSRGARVPVLNLQGVSSESNFQADLTVPLAYLVNEYGPVRSALKESQRRVLREFVDSLASKFKDLPADEAEDVDE